MQYPLISVVMPVWNGERYVAEAIDSILAQTFSQWELIVVDDGSTDGTREIVRSRASDRRIRLFQLDHSGIVHALNFGMAQSRSEWIARQDADDVSIPTRLQCQWDALQRSQPAVLSYTNVELIGESIPASRPPRLTRTRSLLALRLCYQSPVVHSTVIFRKETAMRVGGYLPDERHAEDFSLWGRLLEEGAFVALRGKLLKYRLHHGSVSMQNADLQKEVARRIAVRHCQRFLGLAENDAQRAYRILSTPANHRRFADWMWFLSRVANGLRWKSSEAYAWLLWQSLKQVLQRRGSPPTNPTFGSSDLRASADQ